MSEAIIGTAELAEKTGLSQRMIRLKAKAGDIPSRVVCPGRRGCRFKEDERLRMWTDDHTVNPCEPVRRGRKPTAAYFKRGLAKPKPDSPYAITNLLDEWGEISRALERRIRRLKPFISPTGAQLLVTAMEPLMNLRDSLLKMAASGSAR
jgi:hypothetical protein